MVNDRIHPRSPSGGLQPLMFGVLRLLDQQPLFYRLWAVL